MRQKTAEQSKQRVYFTVFAFEIPNMRRASRCGIDAASGGPVEEGNGEPTQWGWGFGSAEMLPECPFGAVMSRFHTSGIVSSCLFAAQHRIHHLINSASIALGNSAVAVRARGLGRTEILGVDSFWDRYAPFMVVVMYNVMYASRNLGGPDSAAWRCPMSPDNAEAGTEDTGRS